MRFSLVAIAWSASSLLSSSVADATCSDLVSSIQVSDTISFQYTVSVTDETTKQGVIMAKLTYAGLGYVALGVSETGKMFPSTAVIGMSPDAEILKYEISERSLSSVIESPAQTLEGYFVQNETHSVLSFAKELQEDGDIDIVIGMNQMIYAVGTDNTLAYHGYGRGTFELDLSGACPVKGSAESSVATIDCSVPQYSESVNGDVVLTWVANLDDTTGVGRFMAEVAYAGTGYVALGISESGGMVPATAVIGLDPATPVKKYDMTQKSISGVVASSSQTLEDASFEQNGTHSILTFTKIMQEEGDVPLEFGNNQMVWAVGESNNLGYHGYRRGSFELHVSRCDPFGNLNAPPPGPPMEASEEEAQDCSKFRDVVEFEDGAVRFTYVVRLDEDNKTNGFLTAEMTYEGQGWVGFAVAGNSMGTMIPSDAIIGQPGTDTVPRKYSLALGPQSAVNPMEDDLQTLVNHTIVQNDTHTVLSFSKRLKETETEFEIDPNGDNTFLWAYGSSNKLAYHARRGSFQLSLSPCASGGSSPRGASLMASSAPIATSPPTAAPTLSPVEPVVSGADHATILPLEPAANWTAIPPVSSTDEPPTSKAAAGITRALSTLQVFSLVSFCLFHL